ncbi:MULTISPECIES: hypothetical protein [unclassified Methylophaga]|jgi:hypothetical protein|uniref:hypothetical protein n=1 Tax=unclassified Methylophaga TaxID=2629249 RepID=UPI00259D183E|nr:MULTISPECIES: hypothetical protein [unclassified Methylophaga]|tara:strand:+ start:7791 stop:8471 length:681 start_codon:yes stop_codon:yes gene_type:complete
MKNFEIRKLLVSDDSEAREQFERDISNEIDELSDLFADSLQNLKESDCAKDESTRAGIVSGYLHLAIESAVTATQLLSLGHIAPAGNSMRISYESLCIAALMRKNIKVTVLNGKYKFDFYNDFMDKRPHARADKVVALVLKNNKLLSISDKGCEFLKAARDFYNAYSHASHLFVHSKIKPSTKQMYIAGGYDSERKSDFESQLKYIVTYCKNIKTWVTSIAYNVPS